MFLHPRPLTAFVLILTLVAADTARAAQPARAEGVQAIDGEWVYVEDKTPGRPVEQRGPNSGPRHRIRVEKDAVVIVRSDGEIRMALDGSQTDVVRSFGTSRYRGQWKDGSYVYEIVPIREGKPAEKGMIRWTLSVTAEGMLVKVALDPPAGSESVSLFRKPNDIPPPTPAKATMADLAWLSGAWTGTRGTGGAISIEERWGPPLGGAMLATSRTVSKGRMTAFEFLRVVERNGGLVYVAQPGGRPATEFVLTEITKTKAVFENPRYDSPQRIAYELTAEGGLTASIGMINGGRPTKFEFKREAVK